MTRVRLILTLLTLLLVVASFAQPAPDAAVVGRVKDTQAQAVSGAEVWLERLSITANVAPDVLARGETQADGSFALSLEGVQALDPGDASTRLRLVIDRPHFVRHVLTLSRSQRETLTAAGVVTVGEVAVTRKITPAFWVASVVFVLVLIFIATGWLHNTLAALFGVSLIFIVSYLGALVNPDLYIFDFERALEYLDWNVVFLIMGMMMVIAVIEHTGVFQWLAFAAYRGSRGRLPVLLAILVVIASVGSAVLDNVTTMLLMTPITVRIALTLGVNPLALLMPTVFASNVAGVSTLVGTPTNILIGSFADISFNDFLVNQTPGVVAALIALVLYSQVVYRKELAQAREASPQLLETLRSSAQITEPGNLRKAGWVGLGMLLLFVLGERIHLGPAVTALIGASALLVWIRPDIEAMIRAVDWTTLVFFMALFMVVGAIQEVGLIAQIADILARLVGDNLILAMIVVIWSSALLSTVIANIPFTAAMLPVIAYLSASIPGAESKVLFYCLSVGAAMGGNGSLIGASANMVTAGISERAGYPISYAYFLRRGLPVLFITVSLTTLWLLLRFLVLAGP